MSRARASLLLTLLLATSCGSSESENAGPQNQAGSGGSSGATAEAGADVSSPPDASPDTTIIIGCNPKCVSPQTCSVTNVCIDAGTCAADGDCQGGMKCDTPTKTCVPGGGCFAQEAKAEAIPPNLLIVLDRSCSMKTLVNGTPKWTIAVGAIDKLLTSYNARIRFGLTLFPDIEGGECGQGAIPIPVAPGNETKIDDLLTKSLDKADPYYPDGPCVTNIDTAMKQAATETALDDPDRDSFVLLATDGKQAGCNAAGGDTGTTQIITDLFQKRGVPTFVIGFGSEVDPAQLNVFAEAGGVTTGDPTTKFYLAEDQASLEAAMQTIASKTLSCVMNLDQPPPDANKIYVFFDNTTEVPQDGTHTEGWDYDATTNQVTFYGKACTDLKEGKVTDVDVVFNCKQATPD